MPRTSASQTFYRAVLAALLAVAIVCAQAQTEAPAAPKRALKPEEYGKWERLGPVDLSDNGLWFVGRVLTVDGDARLVVRSCDGPERWTVPNPGPTAFSDDSRWVAYSIGMPREMAEALREAKKQPETKLGLRSLPAGEERVFERVQTWAFLKGSRYLLVQHMRADGQTVGGGDLEVVNLADGTSAVFGNVATYSPNKAGTLVALGIESSSGLRGVQVLDPSNCSVRTVHWGKHTYPAVAWAEERDVLGVLVGDKDQKKLGDKHTVLLAEDLRGPKLKLTTYDPAGRVEFPSGWRIAEWGGLDLSDDGSEASFGIQVWEDVKTPSKVKEQDKTNVEVWHWKDPEVMPLQRMTASAESHRVVRCFWRPGANRFVLVGEKDLDNVAVLKGFRYVVAQDSKPYRSGVKVGGIDYADVVLFDVASGKRTVLLKRVPQNVGRLGAAAVYPSPEGNWLAVFKDRAWWLVELATGTWTNVAAGLKADFTDRLDDHALPDRPASETPVWLKDDAGVVLYTDYDAYVVTPKTKRVVRLTEGEPEGIRFRLIDAGFDEEGIRRTDPLYFAMQNQHTFATGIYRIDTKGEGNVLVQEDSLIVFAARSKNTDRVLFVRQSFGESAAAFMTNLLFTQAKPMLATNPQQAAFLWGKEELLTYKDAVGRELHARLIYPADYKPGKSYPMVVSVYERQSQEFHRYATPSNMDPYNAQHFSQAGYFVLLPDIAYRKGEPGVSALECVEASVKAALARRAGIDAKRLGLCGHSWGGYETAFIATRSKLFCAYVAGAPVTDLFSMYNSFYWGTGQTDQVIFESSQGRMGSPWWEDVKRYLANSPLQHAADIKAPILVAVGDKDGAVDWRQALYLYQTMRRMGKPAVLLVYPGENHFPSRKGNQLDFARRTRHFFDVYLKGVKPESWVTDGVPFEKMEEEQERSSKPSQE